MALEDLVVFNRQLSEITSETLAQMVDKFNAASAGAIVLSTQGFEGDFMREREWASLHSAQRRVDRYNTLSSASETDLASQQYSTVKVAGGFGPIALEPAQMTWIMKTPEEAIAVISQMAAEAIMKDQLNSAIAAAVAAIENQATAKNDVSASAALTYSALNGAHAKFGDHSASIVANVMNGASYHNLIGQNLANSTRLFDANGVTVVDILGKAVIVTDAPALSDTSGSPNKSKALGLVSGGVTVTDGGDFIANIDTSNGNTRIKSTWQADYSFGISLKGYTWDETNGGRTPTDAEIATGSNWDKVATDIKHTAGVIAIGDTDA